MPSYLHTLHFLPVFFLLAFKHGLKTLISRPDGFQFLDSCTSIFRRILVCLPFQRFFHGQGLCGLKLFLWGKTSEITRDV